MFTPAIFPSAQPSLQLVTLARINGSHLLAFMALP